MITVAELLRAIEDGGPFPRAEVVVDLDGQLVIVDRVVVSVNLVTIVTAVVDSEETS